MIELHSNRRKNTQIDTIVAKRRFSHGISTSLYFAVFFTLSFFVQQPSDAADTDMNRSDETMAIVQKSSGVEIHVTSAQPFPARAMPPILHIGGMTFRKNMPAPDGSMHTLVFLLSREDYAGLSSGQEVTVSYGGSRPRRSGWKFGALEK